MGVLMHFMDIKIINGNNDKLQEGNVFVYPNIYFRNNIILFIICILIIYI
jgi:hypothetical protein